MTVNRINLTRLASCALLAAFLMAGLSATPALAQDYKKNFNAGLEAYKASNFSQARAKFAEAATGAESAGDAEIAQKSKNAAAQMDYKLGNAALKAENYEQALTHYKAGQAMFSGYVLNKYGEGLALKKLGRIDEALTVWNEVAKSGNRKAGRTAEKAIRDHFYFQASSAVSKKNPTSSDADRAVAALEASTQYLEPDADYYYYTAVAHNIRGNTSACITAANTALDMHRGSRTDKAKIYFVKGEALMYSGDTEGAKAAFANAAYGSYKASAEHYLNTL